MPAAGLVKKAATYEDLLQVPDHLVAEILEGELYATPRPALRHANATSVLGAEIGGPFHIGRGGPGGWWILFEPELHLHRDIIVPDLAGWRTARLPAIPDTAFLTIEPDWVCETISPSTEGMDRGKKLAIYAREGVSHVWLVNPASETLEILALTGGRWTILASHVGADSVRAEPFDAIELDLSLLWATS
jgi:Uma2 family endonuclease